MKGTGVRRGYTQGLLQATGAAPGVVARLPRVAERRDAAGHSPGSCLPEPSAAGASGTPRAALRACTNHTGWFIAALLQVRASAVHQASSCSEVCRLPLLVPSEGLVKMERAVEQGRSPL